MKDIPRKHYLPEEIGSEAENHSKVRIRYRFSQEQKQLVGEP